jgi:hypothetical protein
MLLHVDPPLQISDSIRGFTGTVTFDPSTVRPHRFLPGAASVSGSLVWQRSNDSTMTVSYSNGEIIGDIVLGFEFDGLSTGRPLSIVQGEITLDTLRPSAIDTGLIYLNGCEVGLIRNFSRRAQVQALERDPSGDGVVLRFTAPVGAAGAVRVVDLMGEERYRGEIGEIMQEEGLCRIPMAELSTGAYLILLRIADDTSVVRVQWSR